MIIARIIIDKGDEVFHAISNHEALEVVGVRMNRVQQVCVACNIWKRLLYGLDMYADFTFSGLSPPQCGNKPSFFILNIFL